MLGAFSTCVHAQSRMTAAVTTLAIASPCRKLAFSSASSCKKRVHAPSFPRNRSQPYVEIQRRLHTCASQTRMECRMPAWGAGKRHKQYFHLFPPARNQYLLQYPRVGGSILFDVWGRQMATRKGPWVCWIFSGLFRTASGSPEKVRNPIPFERKQQRRTDIGPFREFHMGVLVWSIVRIRCITRAPAPWAISKSCWGRSVHVCMPKAG